MIMARVDRNVLERVVFVRQAKKILDAFFNDTEAYPDVEFLQRKGICKILAEEYSPLVSLAQHLTGAVAVRLLPQGNA
jgi:hypothetical protein